MENKKKRKSNVKVIPLGGLGEISKNITAFEYDDEIIVVDCGLAFPDEEMYGVDLVIPDIKYLLDNKEKVKGFFFTHGHEDHIGSVPYILKQLNVPVYATRFTLSLIKGKLEEHNMVKDCILNEVNVGETIKTNHFSVEFVRTCHSIADACALVINTPQGIIVHTGDFKIDYTPVDGEVIDLQYFAKLGKRKVLLLMADSTNVGRSGYTISEKIIGENLTRLFGKAKERVIVATFASNVHRVQQIINSSIHYGRKVALSGRSMEKICTIAIEEGYLHIPDGVLIDIDDINKYKPNEVTIITTGSQGEPMAALSRIANGNHRKIQLEEGDFIIISASPIPGNKVYISKLIDRLISKGAEVIYDAMEEVHVSGHACQEELKLIHALIRPKFFMPIHGEYRHLRRHGLLAQSLGMNEKNIFLIDNGMGLELSKYKARVVGPFPVGSIMVDGTGIGDVGNVVLRDRKFLAKDGILTAVITIDRNAMKIVAGPDIVTRGFIYVKESNDLVREAKKVAKDEIEKCLDKDITEWSVLKSQVRTALGQFLYGKTKRKPVIIPIFMEVNSGKK